MQETWQLSSLLPQNDKGAAAKGGSPLITSGYVFDFLLLFFLYLPDPVNLPEKERQHLGVVEYDNLHAYLLHFRQVKIRTNAASTHTTFGGRIAAAITPAPKHTGAAQLLHLLNRSPS